jgi:hypothetical protein
MPLGVIFTLPLTDYHLKETEWRWMREPNELATELWTSLGKTKCKSASLEPYLLAIAIGSVVTGVAYAVIKQRLK